MLCQDLSPDTCSLGKMPSLPKDELYHFIGCANAQLNWKTGFFIRQIKVFSYSPEVGGASRPALKIIHSLSVMS